MQGAVRRQWSSIAKHCNAADADPGPNPEGQLPAGALPRCGWLVENDYTSPPVPCTASRRQPVRGMILIETGSMPQDS